MADSTTKRQRFVAEITAVVDAIGTQQTFYFATSGFSTKPSDTPANTYISGRLEHPGTFRRELFSGNAVMGGIRPSWGELSLYNNDGSLDGWANYGISGGKVIVRMGDEDAAYPAGYTTVYIAYTQNMVADFTRIKIRIRDRLLLLDQPLLKTAFAGTGGLEGTSELVGKLKQRVISSPTYFPPILLDYNLQLYFVQSNPKGLGNITILEGGSEITQGSDYTSSSDMLSTSPSAGQARVWYGSLDGSIKNGPVYFRLGSVPVFDMRCLSTGTALSNAAVDLGSLADEAGISGASSTSPSVLAGSLFIDDNRTFAEVMDDSCKSLFGYYGMSREDTFYNGYFDEPDVSSTYTFDKYSIKNLLREPINNMDAPIYNVTVNCGQTYKSNLTGSATSSIKEKLTRDPWWVSSNITNSSIKTANPGALSSVIEIKSRNFLNSLDLTTFGNNFLSLFGVRREFYSLVVPLNSTTINLELNDTVKLKHHRFGLSSGKNFKIIVQEIDCKARTIKYGLWG